MIKIKEAEKYLVIPVAVSKCGPKLEDYLAIREACFLNILPKDYIFPKKMVVANGEPILNITKWLYEFAAATGT